MLDNYKFTCMLSLYILLSNTMFCLLYYSILNVQAYRGKAIKDFQLNIAIAFGCILISPSVYTTQLANTLELIYLNFTLLSK